VKETFILKGFDSTIGTAKRCFSPYDYDGVQVALIKKAGGIPFVKTNVP
jgi:fatty acid amide hydrolase